MVFRELGRRIGIGRDKVIPVREIYQPPPRLETPLESQPFFMGPINGNPERWGVETGGKIISCFEGMPEQIKNQKESFLKAKALIF